MLSSPRVHAIVRDCLPDTADDPAPKVKVQGIVTTYVLLVAKLAEHKAEIAAMLQDLPAAFDVSRGGWSFLNMCINRDGEQWTDLHRDMEALCVLAIGTDQGKFTTARELWSVMPGGMPDFVVTVADPEPVTEETHAEQT